MDEPTAIRPFSSGEQLTAWEAVNCDRCTKGNRIDPHCEILIAIDVAGWGDETVSRDIAQRMGLIDATGNPHGQQNWSCGELVLLEAYRP